MGLFQRKKLTSEEFLQLHQSIGKLQNIVDTLETKVLIMRKDMKRRAFKEDKTEDSEEEDLYNNQLVPENFNKLSNLKK